jgi:hypothetical protein
MALFRRIIPMIGNRLRVGWGESSATHQRTALWHRWVTPTYEERDDTRIETDDIAPRRVPGRPCGIEARELPPPKPLLRI